MDADARDDIQQWRIALASLLGLAIEDDWAAGIDANLAVLADNMRLVEGLQLPDDLDPAATFEA